jgi:hypothetical protein
MSKPDRIFFDDKKKLFYTITPFGNYKITDSSVNLFYDAIKQFNFPHENKLIKKMTDTRVINPEYFVSKSINIKDIYDLTDDVLDYYLNKIRKIAIDIVNETKEINEIKFDEAVNFFFYKQEEKQKQKKEYKLLPNMINVKGGNNIFMNTFKGTKFGIELETCNIIKFYYFDIDDVLIFFNHIIKKIIINAIEYFLFGDDTSYNSKQAGKMWTLQSDITIDCNGYEFIPSNDTDDYIPVEIVTPILITNDNSKIKYNINFYNAQVAVSF